MVPGGVGPVYQADPLGRRGERHAYACARANPAKFIDPHGLKCTRDCPDCPKGVWLVYGADISFTVKLATLGYVVVESVFLTQNVYLPAKRAHSLRFAQSCPEPACGQALREMQVSR